MKSSSLYYISGDLGCLCVRSGFQLCLLILISILYRCLAREPALLLVLNANSSQAVWKSCCKCDKEALGASARASADCKLILLPCLSGKLDGKKSLKYGRHFLRALLWAAVSRCIPIRSVFPTPLYYRATATAFQQVHG